MEFVQDYKSAAAKIITLLEDDLKSIRTGRATPSLLDSLQIEAYPGQPKMRMQELATVTTEGPLTLVIVPFDPSVVGAIEKSILTSDLGFSPRVQDTRLLIQIPAMNEEQREKFVKLMGQRVEERKNMIRQARDESRRKIKAGVEAKEVTEDEKFRIEKEIDQATEEFMKQIQSLRERKEAEIRQV